MSDSILTAKPAKVATAVKMIYLVVAIGIVRTGMTVVRHLDVRSPHFYISTKLMIYAVSVFLIYQTSKRRNWARWSLIVIFAISIPLAILPTFDSFDHSPLHTLLGFLQLGLYIIAILFLFHRTSSSWFRSGNGPN
jgi:hypothetical protein